MTHGIRLGAAALALCMIGSACKDEQGAQDEAEEQKAEAAAEPAAGQPVADEPETSTEDEQAAVEQYRGPCRITWGDERTAEFEYQEDGGSIALDEDGDGEPDTCGSYQEKDGRVQTLTMDEGCDEKTDSTIEFDYDPDVNLADATMKNERGGTQPLTVVMLPGFLGLQPGYPFPGKRDRLTLEAEDGLVRSVETNRRRDGQKVSFTYDAKGNVASIHEDIGNDGSVEVRFGYEYDGAGNIERINTVSHDQPMAAELDYSCWQ